MKPFLVVDDEPAIADLIAMTLRQQGYVCDIANDGETAADLMQENNYSLALFDIMLPEINGYDLLEYAITLDMPVIFITAKGALQDRVKGLRLGADDYIVKPFEPEELVARVESLLRRTGQSVSDITVGDVVMEQQSRKVMQNGKPVILTPREFEVLLQLMQKPGIALQREVLYEKVWGDEADFDSRTLDLHINRIRKKLNWQKQIRTLYKIGYILEVEIT